MHIKTILSHSSTLEREIKELKEDYLLAEFGSRPRLDSDIREMKELLENRISRQSSYASSFKKPVIRREASVFNESESEESKSLLKKQASVRFNK